MLVLLITKKVEGAEKFMANFRATGQLTSIILMFVVELAGRQTQLAKKNPEEEESSFFKKIK
jgi:hypothetical protein